MSHRCRPPNFPTGARGRSGTISWQWAWRKRGFASGYLARHGCLGQRSFADPSSEYIEDSVCQLLCSCQPADVLRGDHSIAVTSVVTSHLPGQSPYLYRPIKPQPLHQRLPLAAAGASRAPPHVEFRYVSKKARASCPWAGGWVMPVSPPLETFMGISYQGGKKKLPMPLPKL